MVFAFLSLKTMKEEASLDCPQAAFSTAWCTIPDTTVYQNKGEKRGLKVAGEKVWEGEEPVLIRSAFTLHARQHVMNSKTSYG